MGWWWRRGESDRVLGRSKWCEGEREESEKNWGGGSRSFSYRSSIPCLERACHASMVTRGGSRGNAAAITGTTLANHGPRVYFQSGDRRVGAQRTGRNHRGN